jgi:malonyl-CoA O-methyltransferase
VTNPELSNSSADITNELQRVAVAFTHAKRREPSFIAAEIAQRMGEKLSLITVPVASVNLQCLPCDAQSLPELSSKFGEAAGLPAHEGDIKHGLKNWLNRFLKNTDTVNSKSPESVNNMRQYKMIEGVWSEKADLLWSNLATLSHPDPLALPKRWADAIKSGGFVMFSSLGPDTAQEVVAMLRDEGVKPNTRNLVDMHDWGDALVHAGFADPVMDMEKITLTYREVNTALQELAALMASKPMRVGLASRATHAQRLRALEAKRNAQGVIPITLEVIYGHAFKVERAAKSSGTTVDELKATLPSQRS